MWPHRLARDRLLRIWLRRRDRDRLLLMWARLREGSLLLPVWPRLREADRLRLLLKKQRLLPNLRAPLVLSNLKEAVQARGNTSFRVPEVSRRSLRRGGENDSLPGRRGR